MPATTRFDVVMIGHIARDKVAVDGKAQTTPGGAVYYGSLALRHLGHDIGVITRLHPNDFALLDDLKTAGVSVFAEPAPETSGIENIYTSTDMERRTCKPLGFAGPFLVSEIPEVTARIYAIVPIIAGEVSLTVLKALATRGPVALDIQGFVRVREGDELVFRQWPDLAEGLAHTSYLKVDLAEAELLTGETDMAEAARRLAAYGPREVIVTQSSGVIVYAEGRIHQAPFSSRSLAGRTGRGDTCFATYLGKRLTASPAEACRWAAAVTSLKQEQPGPWNGDLAPVEALLDQTTPTQAS